MEELTRAYLNWLLDRSEVQHACILILDPLLGENAAAANYRHVLKNSELTIHRHWAGTKLICDQLSYLSGVRESF